jgi:4-amino-4-deoxy-L-arabinose transferase-like glycosyltransferase
MQSKNKLKELLTQNLPLLLVLLGILLISVSIGPFENSDTSLEFNTALNVVKSGMPYGNSFGHLINEPPLGFYIQALFLIVFGSSMGTGVFLTALFGLGCAFLTYKIGKFFYDKSTGLLAAALFGLTPWQLILSRSFLIDVQCLFFSLLFLYAGFLAIRKDSLKLFILSGGLFAVAFLTKFYAVFCLVPLLIFYIYSKPKSLKRIVSWTGLFFVPIFLSSYLWYDVITGQGLLSIVIHYDFTNPNAIHIAPSYFFFANFIIYTMGFFFAAAALLSFAIGVAFRKLFTKTIIFDLTCLLTIVVVVLVNVYLGAFLNLQAPYYEAIKFDYQALPFFALMAASLATKSISLFNLAKAKRNMSRIAFFSSAILGLVLLGLAISINVFHVHDFSTWPYLLFKVTPEALVGYSLFVATPTAEGTLLMGMQYLGFSLVLSALALRFYQKKLTPAILDSYRNEFDPKLKSEKLQT